MGHALGPLIVRFTIRNTNGLRMDSRRDGFYKNAG